MTGIYNKSLKEKLQARLDGVFTRESFDFYCEIPTALQVDEDVYVRKLLFLHYSPLAINTPLISSEDDIDSTIELIRTRMISAYQNEIDRLNKLITNLTKE